MVMTRRFQLQGLSGHELHIGFPTPPGTGANHCAGPEALHMENFTPFVLHAIEDDPQATGQSTESFSGQNSRNAMHDCATRIKRSRSPWRGVKRLVNSLVHCRLPGRRVQIAHR